MSIPDQHFAQIVEDAKSNADVLGCILVGSRGKGFETESSDYDAVLIVADEALKILKDKYENLDDKNIDLGVKTLSEFKKEAAWGAPDAWDRYDFAHVKILVDKTGELQSVCDEKSNIPEDVWHEYVSRSLDAYINAVFRSVKCLRNKNVSGARIEASTSIPPLLNVVFGLNKRLAPFFCYAEKELKQYPLDKFPWEVDGFISDILRILGSADLLTQQKLLKDVEQFSRKEGFGKVFDDWEGKDRWAMEYW